MFNGVSQAETLRLTWLEATVSLMALSGGNTTVHAPSLRLPSIQQSSQVWIVGRTDFDRLKTANSKNHSRQSDLNKQDTERQASERKTFGLKDKQAVC